MTFVSQYNIAGKDTINAYTTSGNLSGGVQLTPRSAEFHGPVRFVEEGFPTLVFSVRQLEAE